MVARVKDHFRKRSPSKKEPIDPTTRRFFSKMRKKPKKATLLYMIALLGNLINVLRNICHSFNNNHNQFLSCHPNMSLIWRYLLKSTGLTKERVLRATSIETITSIVWKYEHDKPLVRPELVKELPTKMYRVHEWYMEKLKVA